MATYKILAVLDPGHGGHDPGAVTKKLNEKSANLTEALACRDELRKYKIDVVMTRTTDKYVSLYTRTFIANKYVGDYDIIVFISFHKNAGGGDGIEIYGNLKNAQAVKLAKAIGAQVKEIGQNHRDPLFRDGLATGADLYVIKHTDMTAILIESAFLDNKKDVEIIDTKAEQRAFGVAIAKGVVESYGLEAKDAEKAEKTGYTGAFPKLPKDGYLGKWDQGTAVENLQKFLNWYGGYKLKTDGIFGPLTESAVRKFQKKEDLVVDGLFGKKSLAAAKKVEK